MVTEATSVPSDGDSPHQAEANIAFSEGAEDAIEPLPGKSNDAESAGDSESSEQEKQRAMTQKYHITREGDDLVIAVWTDANLDTSRKNNQETAGSIGDPIRHLSDCHSAEFQDPRIMTLAHYRGDKFVIPWVLCSKWTWMKDIIKLTYGSDEAAKQSIDEGKFQLKREGSMILVDHWDMVAFPWQFVTIKLDSQVAHRFDIWSKTESPNDLIPPPPPVPDQIGTVQEDGKVPDDSHGNRDGLPASSTESNNEATTYQTLVKYRFDFYIKNQFPGPYDNGNFLESKTYDDPMGMEKSSSRGQLVPVLEEINRITFGSQKNTIWKDLISKHGLVLDVDDQVKPKKLHVRSPLLLNALRSIVKYSSNAPSGDDAEVFTDGLFPFPFKELYHHRDELLHFKHETSGARANHTPEYNAECNSHIDILIDYLDNEPTVQLRSVKERWARKVPTTTFTGFWLLMKPGSDVYVQENGQLNAYVVDLVTGGIDYNPWSFSAKTYSVRVWNLVYNGKVITRRSKKIEVPVFDGERDIVSLPLFPTSFQDKLDNGALRKRLIERGQNCLRFARGPTFLEYTGMGLKPGWKKYNRARVVVEHQSLPWTSYEFVSLTSWHLTSNPNGPPVPMGPQYPMPPPPPFGPQFGMTGLGERARAPRCECSQCKVVDSKEGTYVSPTFNNYDSIDPSRTEGLSEHQALLCMSHMFGFVLKDRMYDILDLTCLSKPTLAESAIDELVLRPERNKDTIKAIARTYTESDSQADLFSVDFIRGKGEGQIFLLHGPPGTGKTLTAESVAEYTKRPLLSITAADLGHEPVELERNLLRFFKNAAAWDAIVLLDEADVYLERRSSNDLRRNSIVSIFLRALDYFEGILFFTTNRVGHFDEAFMSRIHVAIGYDPLDDKARVQIWDHLFRKLKENHKNGGPQIDYEYDAKQYVRKSDEVRRLQWNGREIRNAFQTAVALAIADSKTARAKRRPETDCIPLVTEAHLSQVVHMSAAFKRYIMATHEGIDESDLAYRLGNRYDRLEPNSS